MRRGILLTLGLLCLALFLTGTVIRNGINDTDTLVAVSTEARAFSFEAERHLHGYERWCGLSSSPVGEVTRCDSASTLTFQIDGGNQTWGAWVQIMGSGDTPIVDAGNVKYDLHRLVFKAVERNAVIHRIQVGFGASGAAALSAGTYTEVMVRSGTGVIVPGPVDIQDRRQDVGTKAWARAWVLTQNTGTVDFFFGIHEYEE